MTTSLKRSPKPDIKGGRLQEVPLNKTKGLDGRHKWDNLEENGYFTLMKTLKLTKVINSSSQGVTLSSRHNGKQFLTAESNCESHAINPLNLVLQTSKVSTFLEIGILWRKKVISVSRAKCLPNFCMYHRMNDVYIFSSIHWWGSRDY